MGLSRRKLGLETLQVGFWRGPPWSRLTLCSARLYLRLQDSRSCHSEQSEESAVIASAKADSSAWGLGMTILAGLGTAIFRGLSTSCSAMMYDLVVPQGPIVPGFVRHVGQIPTHQIG